MRPTVQPLASYKFGGKRATVATGSGDEIPVYLAVPGKVEHQGVGLLVVHDIFGWGHKNNFQSTDALAALSGLPAFMPHFFFRAPAEARSPFSEADGVPFHPDIPLGSTPGDVTGGSRVLEFTARNEGAYSAGKGKVGEDLRAVLRWMKEKHGIQKTALIGFCYGGYAMIHAALDEEALALGLSAVVGIHPSLMSLKMAAKIRIPVGLLPGNDDPDFTRFLGVLYTNPYLSKPPHMNAPTVMHWRFDDVPHGFCTSRGDFADPLVKRRADEAFDMSWRFVRPHLLGATKPLPARF
ncbi:Alpha/Beta hydrolase protein [Hyaloraphidium curvatum]|nr:Alpha/Beta hydrolase protein [Hyaloraphidium curvatum]